MLVCYNEARCWILESIYQELLTEHSDSYSKPQLKLWARMINCGTPPRVPLITGNTPKCHKPDLSETFRDAAVAVARAFSPPPPSTTVATTTAVPTYIGVSPGKSVELHSKNLEQLRYVQQLYEDNILSHEEQKKMILESIRKLSNQ